MTIFSNVVKEKKLRSVQLKTLELASEVLKHSFGPMGSNTIIKQDTVATKYTKDGHTILSNVLLKGAIEQTTIDDLLDITRHIVKEVGDGTTSVVLLSYYIFQELCKMNLDEDITPSNIIDAFKEVVADICKLIEANGRVATTKDIYDIALISTNNNTNISENIASIYEEFGLDVFIDVGISNTTDNILKSYDGMTLNSGYGDQCYVNTKEGNCRLRNPNIYVFEDPIDTPEMISFFDKIIADNIHTPLSVGSELVPTVILAPKLSRDMSKYMESLCDSMYKAPINAKIPFLLVTNIYEIDSYMDIAKMCNCNTIKKYIDPQIQLLDIEKGIAPTLETVCNFAGTADVVESNELKTKFINPDAMFADDAKTIYSPAYESLLNFLESSLTVAKDNNENLNVIGTIKRRINSLKSNMVDYLIGGVTVADRDAVRDLVEDAVLCCRSAALNGIGYGANYEALLALSEYKELTNTPLKIAITKVLYNSYKEVSRVLYESINKDITFVDKSLEEGCPLNLRTKEFDHKVLTSIKSDIVILETISKIITLMFTSNQFIVPTYLDNTYLDKDDLN